MNYKRLTLKTTVLRTGKQLLIASLRTSALLACLLYAFQDKLVLHPSHTSLLRPGAQPEAEADISDWFVGDEFIGRVFLPENPPVGTVVYFHGNGGSIDERGLIAKSLTHQGLRVVLVEYPGFGGRDGKATLVAALDASKAAATHAIQRWPGPIYLAGESFGAGVAAQVAKEHKADSKGLLLFTPWESFDDLVDQKLLGLPVHWLLKVKMETVDALKGYPGSVTIVGAKKDELIPVVHARRLTKGLPVSSYVELEFASHNDWPEYMTESQWQMLASKLTTAHPPPLSATARN